MMFADFALYFDEPLQHAHASDEQRNQSQF